MGAIVLIIWTGVVLTLGLRSDIKERKEQNKQSIQAIKNNP